MLVEIGIDGRELGKRSLIHDFEDLELELVLNADAGERSRKRFNERIGRQRIRARFQPRLVEQVGDAAIERNQLVMRFVLDDTNDIAGNHRFVHRLMIDERQLACVELRKIGFGGL